MAMYINSGNKKKVSDIFIHADGEKKKVKSVWGNKEGIPKKIFENTNKPIQTKRIMVMSAQYAGTIGKILYIENFEKKITEIIVSKEGYLRSVTFGKDKFVAVGVKGQIYYSIDGKVWTRSSLENLDTTEILYCVTYGNGIFVCAGGSGKIYYSADGINWNKSGVNVTRDTMKGAVYGDDRFVLVGTSSTALYSMDGISWTKMTGTYSGYLNAVTYGNGRFVAVGSSGRTYYSTNKTSWIQMNGPIPSSYTLSDVVYGNGKFICTGGYPFYSTDGENWIQSQGLAGTSYIGYCDGKYIMLDATNNVYMSEDGLSWRLSGYSIESNGTTILDVAFNIDGGYGGY